MRYCIPWKVEFPLSVPVLAQLALNAGVCHVSAVDTPPFTEDLTTAPLIHCVIPADEAPTSRCGYPTADWGVTDVSPETHATLADSPKPVSTGEKAIKPCEPNPTRAPAFV